MSFRPLTPYVISDRLSFYKIAGFQGINHGRDLLRLHFQNLRRFRFQLLLRHVDVPFLGHPVQCIGHAGLNTAGIIFG